MKNYIYRFLLVTTGVLIVSMSLHAQPTFEYVKAFKGAFPIEFRCVTATMDGGIAVATVDDDYSSFSDAGNITLWNFDGEGNLLWQKFNGVYEQSGSIPTCLIQLRDSGFLIGGYLGSAEQRGCSCGAQRGLSYPSRLPLLVIVAPNLYEGPSEVL